MGQENAIVASGLSKSYRIWKDPSRRLLSPLFMEMGRWLPAAASRSFQRKAADGYQDFFALRDVSFEVKRGEAVGIVGRNGAGKSTLLQLLAGTLQPTSGSIQVNGRVAALLELGAGFNTDFTGRENVFLSGAVLGLSQKEMNERFDEIAAFADIGEFIEQPVKTYSSGMMMRLAFAVNTCVNPDILIVDEALSVGDAPFQAKCFRRLRQLIDQGVSLLFVSHDLGTVRSICSRALWLKNGKPEMWGPAKEVAKEYEKFCWQEQGVQAVAAPGSTPAPVGTATAANNPRLSVPELLYQRNEQFEKLAAVERWGTGAATIQNVLVLQSDGQRVSSFNYDSEVEVWLLLRLHEPISSDFMLGLRINTLKGEAVMAIQELDQILRIEGSPGDMFAINTRFRLPLHHADYSLRVAIMGYKNGVLQRGPAYDFGQAVVWDVLESCAVLTVRPYVHFPLSGPVHIHGATSLHRLTPQP